MGACHTTTAKQNAKEKQTPKVTPQNDKSKSENFSWLDSEEDTAPQVDAYGTSLNISPSLVNFFVRFYNKKLTALKNAYDLFENNQRKKEFTDKLAKQNSITTEEAELWVAAYIDYMILMAWLRFAVEEKEMYAPFAIQQTQRLHLSCFAEYEKFCAILTENKGLLHYCPQKMVTMYESVDTMEFLYDELKESVMVYIYDNKEIYPTESKIRSEIIELWDSFYDNFIKVEYSFNLSQNPRSHQMITQAISSIVTENHNFPLTYEGVELLRNSLALPIETSQSTGLEILPLLKEKTHENVAKTIDEGKLPLNFARILAWERVIPIDTARQWVVEYKKFLFLCSIGQPVKNFFTEEIKQVWLLHQSYTKNYEKFMKDLKESQAANQIQTFPETVGFGSEEQGLYKSNFGDFNSPSKFEGEFSIAFDAQILKKQEELLNKKIQRTLVEA